MKSAITVSLVPDPQGGPFVVTDGVADGAARAAELGFDAEEICPPAAEAIERAVLAEEQDLVLAGEVVVEVGGGEVGRAGDVAHAGGGVAAVPDDAGRGPEDLEAAPVTPPPATLGPHFQTTVRRSNHGSIVRFPSAVVKRGPPPTRPSPDRRRLGSV
jgi:hypothetical protein